MGNSDGSCIRFPWIELKHDFTIHHLCDSNEIANENFPHLQWFQVKELSISNWFHVKLLKLRESRINGNSRHRTEVKRDSMKCWKMLLIWAYLKNLNFGFGYQNFQKSRIEIWSESFKIPKKYLDLEHWIKECKINKKYPLHKWCP